MKVHIGGGHGTTPWMKPSALRLRSVQMLKIPCLLVK